MHTLGEITSAARADLITGFHDRAAVHQGGVVWGVEYRSYGETREVCCACEGAAECSVGV